MKKRSYPYKHRFEINQDHCIQCDWCMTSKPVEDCIVMLKNTTPPTDQNACQPTDDTADMNMIWINPDACTRCGICVQVCPTQAIDRKMEVSS